MWTNERRDMAARQSVQSNELLRRAYKYIARNTTLPSKVRHQAQLELNAFPAQARPVAVKERCIATGRGRGIITDFGLCRVRLQENALLTRSTSSARERSPANCLAWKRRHGSCRRGTRCGAECAVRRLVDHTDTCL